MIRRPLLAALSLLAVVAAPAGAQATARSTDVVDRIVAVVGDSVVLLTQVQEEVERMRLQNPASIPRDEAGLEALYRQMLDTWVNRLLVVQAAAKDSLVKTDEARVDEIVSQELQQRARQYPRGQPELQEALAREGLTLSEYRDILRNQVRQDQLQQMFLQRRLQDAAPVEVSEDELRRAFADASGQLQDRPRLLTFEQVVMAPQPSDSAKDAARAEAAALLDSLRAGADFEALAKAHSDDTGSGEIGGDLGWFRRGAMVKEFEDAAFALADGQVSQVVETEFGFHIIKIDRSRAGERKGRHILVRPTVGEGDVARARLRADSVIAQARSGTSMAELFRRYSDPLAPDTLTVSFDQMDQLPPGYGAMRTAAPGDVVGPIEYDTGRGEARIAVLRVREIREAGAYTFEDVKSQLAQQVQRTKQIQRILDELRARTHVEIRM
jgi:peptidyl-prolyl cis-trans isomerase SurA